VACGNSPCGILRRQSMNYFSAALGESSSRYSVVAADVYRSKLKDTLEPAQSTTQRPGSHACTCQSQRVYMHASEYPKPIDQIICTYLPLSTLVPTEIIIACKLLAVTCMCFFMCTHLGQKKSLFLSCTCLQFCAIFFCLVTLLIFCTHLQL
jgi:hypothetical protein